MYSVYLIRSVSNPCKTYVGYKKDVEKRLSEHNSGKAPVTKNNVPWEIEVVIHFKDEKKAKAFEQYLKHGSGHAFAKRHFWISD